jgi:TetR/AcrR family transcriptional regulator, transcriptional repressor for nem operon
MRKGEVTRQRIIAKAAPIFNQRGYAGASMQDLMDATGLEKGGIYRHFVSKEALAVEAFQFALAQSIKVRTSHLDEIPSALDKLRRVVDLFVKEPSAVAGGCPLMNTAIDADDGNVVLRNLALKGIQDWRARLCRIVEAGLHAGEIRKGTEPSRVANSIIAALEGALMMSRLDGTKDALRDAQATLELLLTEIATPPNRNRVRN